MTARTDRQRRLRTRSWFNEDTGCLHALQDVSEINGLYLQKCLKCKCTVETTFQYEDAFDADLSLLFLDLDGVVNYADWGVNHGLVPVPAPYQPSVEDLVRWIDPERIVLVNEIVERTGCKIVLSSSTRSDVRMSLVLAKAGLKAPIFDSTPFLLWKVDPETGGILDTTTRADEIYETWRKHNPRVFCVLDDQDHDWTRLVKHLMKGWSPQEEREKLWHEIFLVQTTFEKGLLREHVERAVTILNALRGGAW